MDFVFKFNLKQRGDTFKQLLPDMKNFGCFPVQIKINCPTNEIVVKLFSEDKSILTLNESVFYETTEFLLLDYKLPITSSNNINISITHMLDGQGKKDISGDILIKYGRLDGYIIYSETLTQTGDEDLLKLLSSISKYCKFAQKIVWSAPKGLTGIRFVPAIQNVSDDYFKTYTFDAVVNEETGVCLIEQQIDENMPFFIQNLKYYKLELLEQSKGVSKLGIHVYGFF